MNKKKALLGTLLLLMFLTANYFIIKSIEPNYERVLDYNRSIDILSSRDPSYLIIDLRDSKDFEKSHFTSSLNMPYTKDCKSIIDLCNKKENKYRKIVLLCYSGNRSANAFENLAISKFPNLIDLSLGFDKIVEFNQDSPLLESGQNEWCD